MKKKIRLEYYYDDNYNNPHNTKQVSYIPAGRIAHAELTDLESPINMTDLSGRETMRKTSSSVLQKLTIKDTTSPLGSEVYYVFPEEGEKFIKAWKNSK